MSASLIYNQTQIFRCHCQGFGESLWTYRNCTDIVFFIVSDKLNYFFIPSQFSLLRMRASENRYLES